MDTDAKGREYPLTATSDVRGRAKPLYTQVRIQQKTSEMVENLEKQRQQLKSVIQSAKATFQMNQEAESQLKLLADQRQNGILTELTYEDLATLPIKLLVPYIQVRVLEDLTAPFKKLKKGTVQQATEGNACLLQQAKELLGKEVIAKEPEYQEVQVPKALEIPKTIQDFNDSNTISTWAPTESWCEEAGKVVHPIPTNGKLAYWKSHLDELNETATILAEKIQSRLPTFLRGRCPHHLQNHWVWTSFISNFLKPTASLAILAGLQTGALRLATPLDSFLNHSLDVFPKVTEDIGDLDGCYLTADTLRGDIIRSGFAEQGLLRRWKEHHRASFLNDIGTRERPQYQLFPHETVPVEQAPNRRGTFQQLEQKLGLGMRKCDRARVLQLFSWTSIDEAHLGDLPYGDRRGGTLDFKKYKHICFMFELFFAVALEPSKNITENPTCEWQLRLYSKNNT